uniref:Uncharacterized protein n=1 Tax=Physcomitrium patens TaxID=3218 RepID=A0A2K1JT78_PHYPA|nr:hypothetical protein PHYPA_014508 [Physcomitrium patens]
MHNKFAYPFYLSNAQKCLYDNFIQLWLQCLSIDIKLVAILIDFIAQLYQLFLYKINNKLKHPKMILFRSSIDLVD